MRFRRAATVSIASIIAVVWAVKHATISALDLGRSSGREPHGLSGEFALMVIPTVDMPGATSDTRFLTAMREQLGRTIRAEQLPVDVLRIHRMERPSD
jgi:hypothetical protein